MSENDLICKIMFQSPEMRTPLWIIGVIEKEQLFSSVNGFIEVKNYGKKTICKEDIVKIIIYKEHQTVVIDKNSLAINRLVSMES